MPTSELDKKYIFIYASLIFLVLGLMTSPTLTAGFSIFIFIPALFVFWDKKSEIKIPKSGYLLLILTAWGILSGFINLDSLVEPSKSFQDLKYYLFAVLFIYPLTYFFKQNKSKHQKVLLTILSWTIIIAFFVGISRAWFKFDPIKMRMGDFHERSGGFVNYMRYGYSSALLFLLGFGVFFKRKDLQEIIPGKTFWIAVTLCLLAIGTSQTRGALLGLVVATPFLLWRFKPKLSCILLALGALFAWVVIYFSFISQTTKYRFLNVNQGSNSVRATQWKIALKATEENPVFGLGPDQFSYNVKHYKEKYGYPYKWYSGHAHNVFLEHMANYGYFGGVLLLIFFVTWFFEMLALKNDFGWIIASYILAFFTSGQVEVIFDVINSHILVFIYALSQSYIYFKPRAIP